MRKIAQSLTIAASLTFLGSRAVFAAPPKFEDLSIVIGNALTAALSFSALLAVGMIIFAGYTYMTSQGDPQKIQQAQGTITWTVVALIFLAISGVAIIALMDFFSIQ
ncbi:MAG: hypothetical protein QY318_02550 [Candidatus Dojkabacteria bacterium]|nr:MAG: hypothetical protein QY318_02550 [Candidatus Dojkabacteria bacterium]